MTAWHIEKSKKSLELAFERAAEFLTIVSENFTGKYFVESGSVVRVLAEHPLDERGQLL